MNYPSQEDEDGVEVADVRSVPAIRDLEDAPLVKSAARALRILEYFDEVQRDARVTEIAAHLLLPQSSTSALLRSLVQMGYLDYDRFRRTYLPTPRVALLGTWLKAGPVQDGRLLRMMESLSQRSHCNIILAVRNGIYAQYIHVIQALTPIRYHVPQGSRRLLAKSGSGAALLAGASDAEVRSIVARTNAEQSEDGGPIDFRSTLANIIHVREKGYMFSRALVTPGAGAIAVPLPASIDGRGRPMAIVISGVLEDLASRESELFEMIREAIATYLSQI